MRVLLGICLLVLALPAWGFQYRIDESALLRPSIVDGQELARRFAAKGYRSLSDLSLARPGLALDDVFISSLWEKSFALKAGLEAPAGLEGRILVEDSLGVLVFHFRHRGTAHVLVAHGIPLEELKDLVRPWLNAETASVWSWFLPRAEAVECSVQTPGPAETLAPVARHIEDDTGLRKIGECGADALRGMKSTAEGTLSFFKNLVTDPKALWAEMKSSFVQLKEFAVNIQSELKAAFAGYSGLTAEEKAAIACTMTGQLIMTGLQAFVSAAALSRALPHLILKLRSATALLRRLGELEKTGLRLPDRARWAQEVISCAL